MLEKKIMEESVVHCDGIKSSPLGFEDYEHYFSFPKEWPKESYICLVGMWLSHEADVSWVRMKYGMMTVDSCPLRIDDDDGNWISKFNAAVIIQTEAIEQYICITADKEIADFIVTFRWYAVDDNEHVSQRYGIFSRTNVSEIGYFCCVSLIGISKYFRVCDIVDQPVKDFTIDSDVPYTMVSSNIFRVDGPCQRFYINALDTEIFVYTHWTFKIY